MSIPTIARTCEVVRRRGNATRSEHGNSPNASVLSGLRSNHFMFRIGALYTPIGWKERSRRCAGSASSGSDSDSSFPLPASTPRGECSLRSDAEKSLLDKRRGNCNPLFVGQIARQLADIKCSSRRDEGDGFACDGINREPDSAAFVDERHPPCVPQKSPGGALLSLMSRRASVIIRFVLPALGKFLPEYFPVRRGKRPECRPFQLVIRGQFRCVAWTMVGEAAEVPIAEVPGTRE